MNTNKILIISTGGTIAGEVISEIKKGEDIRSADEFLEMFKPSLFSLKNKWGIDVVIEHTPLTALDSSDILPKHWTAMADVIKKNYDNYDSFIITHGTNTLGYSSAALSFALANPNKPIILTGSQVPAGMPGSDALTNLENALRVAVWPRETNKIKGVIAVFGSFIITGTRLKKDTEFDYDCFKSFGMGSLGRIGRIIDINETNLNKHLSYLRTSRYPEARGADNLICENDFDMNIASLTEFPGMSPSIFETLVEKNNVSGFILRAFGAGDVSSHLFQVLEYLKSREIPIVVTTQAPNGNSNFQVNEPGQHLRDNNLAIPAYDMSIESQTTKLSWLLSKKNKGELSYSQLCQEMIHDIRGEINVIWEVGL